MQRPRPRGGVRLVGGLGWGDLPALGGGLGLAGSLSFRRVRLEALAHLWPTRRVRLGDTGAGADFLLWTVSARACPQIYPHRRVELPICSGFEAGQVHVRGVRLSEGADTQPPWFAFVLAPALAIPLTATVALWISPEMVVPITRPRFRVDEVGEIHHTAALAVRAVLGLEIRFPRIPAMDRPRSGNEGRGRP